MILGAGEIQTPVIRKAKTEGYFTIVADYNPSAPGFEFADLKLIVSTRDKDEILKNALKYNIDGILTTSDFPVRVVSYVAEKNGLKALSPDSAYLCTNKFLLREKLKSSNLHYPDYFFIKEKKDLVNVTDFPAVIKPVDASASRGVRKVNNQNELLKEYDYTVSFSESKSVIVETFIKGDEFSVEAITYNGKTDIIAITQKYKTGEKNGYFVEFAHKIPADISNQKAELLKTTTLNLINLINLDNSSSHTEIILSENKAYIVEIGARLGGDYIASDLVYLSTGIDMLLNVIKMSVNEEIDTVRKFNRHSAVQFITAENYQSAVNFINSKNENIIKYEIKDFNNKIIKNSNDRMGYIILSAFSDKELNSLLKTVNNEN